MMTNREQLNSCRSVDLAAYLDGELGSVGVDAVEQHLAECTACTAELNEQKHFLRSLDMLRDEKPVEIPADFTKKIVAKAESSVSGLRGPRERFNAIFICVGLGLFVLFTIGTDAGQWAENFGGRLLAIAGFVAETIFSLVLGVAMIVRSFATQFGSEASLLALVSVAIAFMLVFLSRRLVRFDRA